MVLVSEQEQLNRARQFDRATLGEIYDQHSPALYRYCYRLLGNADHAEECVAEVFSRFLHTLRQGNGPRDNLRAYLYRMAHNWITDQWRRKPPPHVELDPGLPDHNQADPSDTVEQQMQANQIRQALAQLTTDQQQVVMLKYVEDWENEQVAVALGKPIGAVKSIQHRALASLRRLLSVERENAHV